MDRAEFGGLSENALSRAFVPQSPELAAILSPARLEENLLLASRFGFKVSKVAPVVRAIAEAAESFYAKAPVEILLSDLREMGTLSVQWSDQTSDPIALTNALTRLAKTTFSKKADALVSLGLNEDSRTANLSLGEDRILRLTTVAGYYNAGSRMDYGLTDTAVRNVLATRSGGGYFLKIGGQYQGTPRESNYYIFIPSNPACLEDAERRLGFIDFRTVLVNLYREATLEGGNSLLQQLRGDNRQRSQVVPGIKTAMNDWELYYLAYSQFVFLLGGSPDGANGLFLKPGESDGTLTVMGRFFEPRLSPELAINRERTSLDAKISGIEVHSELTFNGGASSPLHFNATLSLL